MTATDEIDRALSAVNSGDRLSAQRILAETVRQDPQNAEAWRLLAGVIDDPQKAAYCHDRAAKLEPLPTSPPSPKPTLPSVSSPEAQHPEAESLQGATQSVTPPVKSPDSPKTKKCPYCAETIQDAAIFCRYCGRNLTTGQLTANSSPAFTETQPVLLDQSVENYLKGGWQIINRTPTTAQLKKPKQWNTGCLVLFVFIPALAGFIVPALFGVAIIAFLLAVVDYPLCL